MDQPQQIANGIRVFGSAIVRVAPDIASIEVAVSRIEKKPKDAFTKANADSAAVHNYLKSIGIEDVSSSRIALTQEHEYRNGESKFIGYKARLGYSIVTSELDRAEELLVGVIDAGANELTSVTFQTSRLKDIRRDARQRSVAAAQQKAEMYSKAAGVEIGAVLAIEDVNPETLSGRYEGHVHREPEIDDPGEIKAVDPGAITVGGAVSILFEIKTSNSGR